MGTSRSTRRGFGQVLCEPSGRYRARFTGPDGKRRSAPSTFATRAEAERFLALAHAELLRGNVLAVIPADVTVAEYVARYLDESAPRLRPRTLDHYRATAARWILPPVGIGPDRIALAPMTLGAVSIGLVRQWHAAVIAQAHHDQSQRIQGTRRTHPARAWARAHGMTVSATGTLPTAILDAWHAAGSPAETVAVPEDAGRTGAAHAYQLLRSILAQAVRDGLIPANPAQVRGASTAPHHERRPLSPAEVTALADAVDDRYRAAVLLGAWSGLRPGELFALRRRDLDPAAATVTVTRTLHERAGHGVTFGPPKSDAGRRTVALPRTVADAIADHLDRFTPADPEDLAFTTATGKPLTAPRRSRILRPARAAISRDDVTWHHLRHTGATLAAAAGATMAELQARIGHSTARAAAIYQHASTERDRLIADRLDTLTTTGSPVVPEAGPGRGHLRLVRGGRAGGTVPEHPGPPARAMARGAGL